MPYTLPVFPRTSSGMSGFFFCGIMELPVQTASAISINPNSSVDHSISSSERRLKGIIRLARDKGVKIVIPDPPDGLMVSVDRDHAVAALANILSNAVIFTPGSGVVELEYNQGADEIAVSVSDKGIGIAAESLVRVTEKFFREDNEINRQREGNGLGLYLAKSLLELMDGGLRIESRQGYGTRVTLSFQRAREG